MEKYHSFSIVSRFHKALEVVFQSSCFFTNVSSLLRIINHSDFAIFLLYSQLVNSSVVEIKIHFEQYYLNGFSLKLIRITDIITNIATIFHNILFKKYNSLNIFTQRKMNWNLRNLVSCHAICVTLTIFNL